MAQQSRQRRIVAESLREEFANLVIESANINEMDSEIAPINVLARDAIKAIKAGSVSYDEARYLASLYYTIQRDRIRMQLKLNSLRKAGKPYLLAEFYRDQFLILEKNAAKILISWAKTQPVYQWLSQIRGIGGVLASCLIAYTPPDKCTSAGSLWRYAGIDTDPDSELASHAYSREYKRLYWMIGKSFVMTKSEDSFYYKLYEQRKEYETEKNARGDYAEKAAITLKKYAIGRDTVAYSYYSKGMLPPQHIHARAVRWATKLFLSHFAQVHYEMTFKKPQPTIYAIAVLGHKDYIKPPFYEPLNPNIAAADRIIPLKEAKVEG